MARKKKIGRRDSGTGQIVKDGKFFRARYEVGTNPVTGKPIYETQRCKDHDEAVEAVKRMTTKSGNGGTATTERKNFGQFLDDWLANSIKPTKSHNTHRQYEWLCRVHIKPHLGSKQVDRITRADVQKLLSLKATQTVQAKSKPKEDAPEEVEQIAKDKRPTLSGNSLRLIRACLHSALEEARRHGTTMKNPAAAVALPRKPKDDKKQFLTPDETAKFMKAIDQSDLADLFAFLISTGTRLGEATGVRLQDLDFTLPNRPVVWIRGQLQRIEKRLTYVSGTKTHQERCLPLSKPVADRIKAIQAKRLVDGPNDPDGIVFLNAEGRRLDQKHVTLRLNELCKKAEVPHISPHKLRHTAATLALAETGDLHGVQKLLGHSQVALTSDLYGHATAETLRPLSNAIEKALRPVQQDE